MSDIEEARDLIATLRDNCDHFLERAEAAEAAIQRVRRLHQSSEVTRNVGRDVDGVWTPYCEFDLEAWPCTTVGRLALPYSDHPGFRKVWDA